MAVLLPRRGTASPPGRPAATIGLPALQRGALPLLVQRGRSVSYVTLPVRGLKI